MQEMIQCGINNRWLDGSGNFIDPPNPGVDLLEVYCPAESQLTGQSIRQGLKAIRFGLKEGNLGYYEGRCNLYEIMYRCRPRNVWLSPKCKAWRRWNQLNACKSQELAKRVVEAQSDDQVHLMLCEAVFPFQRARGNAYHCHLEQPAGSEMLNQEPLQIVVQNTMHARCDFCMVGKLKHPVTQMPIQRGT